MSRVSLLAAVAVVAGVSLASLPTAGDAREPEAGGAIAQLAGRWAGHGTVTPARGPSQPFKCVVTYISKGAAGDLHQNLRCQSADYRLDAATRLVINGRQVTGEWQDRIHALSGDVYGLVTKDGFDIQLQGRFFQANMVVVSGGCEQSVKVTPVRADYIREVEASLRKC
jgi:hypothetical protein